MNLFCNVLLLFIFVTTLNLGSAEDNFPSDYFLGAQYRPKLEILKPENGQILDYTTLEIKIKISGYDSTSLFHDTRICISLSSESTGTEQCFERTPDLVYSLRVAFFERGNAIAVSVRSFVVGGVTGLLEGSDTPVAIRTAVQMAIKLHEKNMKTEAEQIYRKVKFHRQLFYLEFNKYIYILLHITMYY
jgi:hypothetical protein